MISTFALAVAAAATLFFLFIFLRRQLGQGEDAAANVSAFNELLKGVDAKLRDGVIDQAAADAERSRILQSMLAAKPAQAPGGRMSFPAAMASGSVAVIALFVFFATQNEASSNGDAAGPAKASSESNQNLALLQAYESREAPPAHPPMEAQAKPAPTVRTADAQPPAAASTPAPQSARPAFGPRVAAPGGGAQPGGASGLADVDTMIQGVAKRLEKNPNNAGDWRMLGWSYFRTSRYAQSAEAYARAVALTPDSAPLKYAYGLALVKASNDQVTPKALEVLESVLLAEPGNFGAIYFKGLAKEQAGDKAGAAEYWTAALTGVADAKERAATLETEALLTTTALFQQTLKAAGAAGGAAKTNAAAPGPEAAPAAKEPAPAQADAPAQPEQPKEQARPAEPAAAQAVSPAEQPEQQKEPAKVADPAAAPAPSPQESSGGK